MVRITTAITYSQLFQIFLSPYQYLFLFKFQKSMKLVIIFKLNRLQISKIPFDIPTIADGVVVIVVAAAYHYFYLYQ